MENDVMPLTAKHLLQRIFRFSSHTCLPVVGHGVGGETDERHDAADEEVALWKLKQFLCCPTAHQTVVGVVVDGLCPKCVHQLVEHQGGVLLEEGVGCTRVAHSVYYVGA